MTNIISGVAGFALAGLLMTAPHAASAMSLKDCSVNYQAAKKDGSLGTRTWVEFRHADCGDAGAAATVVAASTVPAASAPATAGTGTGAPVAAMAGSAPAKAASATPATTTVAAPVDLPSAIDPKFASEKPARARLHTCAESYRAHKKAGTLNGLKWLQKGGGFYSLCNRKLKAAG